MNDRTIKSCDAGADGTAQTNVKTVAEQMLAMEDSFADLQIWADLSDSQYVMLFARREVLQGRPATALR